MYYSDNQKMSVSGLYASINTPEALKGEEVHQLPPFSPCPVHVVDEYENCPDNWMHGSDKASSYFVPVKSGKGLWFDFTQNEHHSHHVAVVISVQGINPINGQKTSALNLEQYKNKCPVHNVDFQQNRFCPECEYDWPAQNYLSTTTRQMLWLDGFRGENGKVRQYIITEEEIRSVAAQMIGEDRVFAIGFAFYLSKTPKPQMQVHEWGLGSGASGSSGCISGYSGHPYNGYPWFSPAGMTWNGKSWDSPPPLPSSINVNWPASSTIPCSVKISGGLCSSLGPQGATGPAGPAGPVGYEATGTPKYINISSATGHKIELRDSNDFVNLNGFPDDDCNSLQQLASGSANLDCFYPTQIDANGNEVNLECSQEDYWLPTRPQEAGPNKNSRMYSKLEQMKLEALANNPQCLGVNENDIAAFKRISIPLKKETKLEIGAGARIAQEIGIDPESIDFWQEEPAGMIYVNYVTEEKANEIIAGGKRKHKEETFLAGLTVGN